MAYVNLVKICFEIEQERKKLLDVVAQSGKGDQDEKNEILETTLERLDDLCERMVDESNQIKKCHKDKESVVLAYYSGIVEELQSASSEYVSSAGKVIYNAFDLLSIGKLKDCSAKMEKIMKNIKGVSMFILGTEKRSPIVDEGLCHIEKIQKVINTMIVNKSSDIISIQRKQFNDLIFNLRKSLRQQVKSTGDTQLREIAKYMLSTIDDVLGGGPHSKLQSLRDRPLKLLCEIVLNTGYKSPEELKNQRQLFFRSISRCGSLNKYSNMEINAADKAAAEDENYFALPSPVRTLKKEEQDLVRQLSDIPDITSSQTGADANTTSTNADKSSIDISSNNRTNNADPSATKQGTATAATGGVAKGKPTSTLPMNPLLFSNAPMPKTNLKPSLSVEHHPVSSSAPNTNAAVANKTVALPPPPEVPIPPPPLRHSADNTNKPAVARPPPTKDQALKQSTHLNVVVSNSAPSVVIPGSFNFPPSVHQDRSAAPSSDKELAEKRARRITVGAPISAKPPIAGTAGPTGPRRLAESEIKPNEKEKPSLPSGAPPVKPNVVSAPQPLPSFNQSSQKQSTAGTKPGPPVKRTGVSNKGGNAVSPSFNPKSSQFPLPPESFPPPLFPVESKPSSPGLPFRKSPSMDSLSSVGSGHDAGNSNGLISPRSLNNSNRLKSKKLPTKANDGLEDKDKKKEKEKEKEKSAKKGKPVPRLPRMSKKAGKQEVEENVGNPTVNKYSPVAQQQQQAKKKMTQPGDPYFDFEYKQQIADFIPLFDDVHSSVVLDHPLYTYLLLLNNDVSLDAVQKIWTKHIAQVKAEELVEENEEITKDELNVRTWAKLVKIYFSDFQFISLLVFFGKHEGKASKDTSLIEKHVSAVKNGVIETIKYVRYLSQEHLIDRKIMRFMIEEYENLSTSVNPLQETLVYCMSSSTHKAEQILEAIKNELCSNLGRLTVMFIQFLSSISTFIDINWKLKYKHTAPNGLEMIAIASATLSTVKHVASLLATKLFVQSELYDRKKGYAENKLSDDMSTDAKKRNLWDDWKADVESNPNEELLSINDLIFKITSTGNHQFLKAFFKTYKAFADPAIIIQKLEERYNVSQNAINEMPENFATIVRMRVGIALDYWTGIDKTSFDPLMLTKVMEFAERFENEGKEKLARKLIKTASVIKSQSKFKSAIQLEGENIIKQSIVSLSQFSCFAGFLIEDERKFAEQLTVYDSYLFQQIKSLELLDLSWSKPKKYFESNNLREFIRASNLFSFFVATSVLLLPTPSQRAKRIEKFMKIGHYLFELKNFSSTMALIAGINHGTIDRLYGTKKMLDPNVVEGFKSVTKVMSPDLSWKAYRTALSQSVPAIPYMGVWLTDLTFIEEGTLDTVEGKINFRKYSMVAQAMQMLEDYQGTSYEIEPIPGMIQMFQHFCSFDEKIMYRLSLLREPRQTNPVFMSK